MPLPFAAVLFRRSFPPPVADHDVVLAVLVHIANPQAMRVPRRPRRTLRRNGMDGPLRVRVFFRGQVGHHSFRTIRCFGIQRDGTDELLLPIAVEVQIGRALVIGHRRDDVLGPQFAGLLGVLEPPGGRAGKIDHEQIGPAIVIHIFRKAAERIAVAAGVHVRGLLRQVVHLPVGGLIPDPSGGNVQLAVLVEIGYRYAFAAELGVELRPLEADGLGWLIRGKCRRENHEAGNGRQDGKEELLHIMGPFKLCTARAMRRVQQSARL